MEAKAKAFNPAPFQAPSSHDPITRPYFIAELSEYTRNSSADRQVRSHFCAERPGNGLNG